MIFKKLVITFSIVSIMLLSAQEKSKKTVETFMEFAARELNVKVADLRISREDMEFYGTGYFRTKLFDRLVSDPCIIGDFINTLSMTILDNADSLWTLSYVPWARIDEGVRRGLLQRPEEIAMDALSESSDIKSRLSVLLNQYFSAATFDTSAISESVCIGLYAILSEIKNSYEWINKGNRNLDKGKLEKLITGLTASEENGLSNYDLKELIEQTNFKALAAGSMDLAYILGFACDLLHDVHIDKTIRISTKYGWLVLGSADNDIYEPLPYLLILDTGGNDTYKAGGIADKEHPVSIIIDYRGDDIYNGKIGCGTGIAGYGIVIDYEGNDRYTATKFGLGTGIFGQGLILDLSGNDEYTTDMYGIGAGICGTGLISDISGNDKYNGFQGCEGFGYIKGCGMLIDKNGNDTYIARDDTVKYPSAQTAEHNTSLAQGAGFGIRADYTDGYSIAGGVGMLIDGNGDDQYSCGVFGQGCGYWFGTGILFDNQGEDEYKGIWYVQGAGAHFALGVLIDSEGDDMFIAEKNMAQGAGHDFTLGLFLDYAGNDYHDAPNLSLGAGNANGMGLFIDFSGDDNYFTHNGLTLGKANTDARGTLRDFMKTIGIFMDCAGKDKYSEPIGSNGKVWRQSSFLKPPLKTELNIGIDF
ncbi:MAG: hypothetical protein ACUVTF_07230 [bacterium]